MEATMMKGLVVFLACVCSSLSVSVSPGEVGSTCFPLGKQTTVSTVGFFEGVPFLGQDVESFQQLPEGSVYLHNWNSLHFVVGEIVSFTHQEWEENTVEQYYSVFNSSHLSVLAKLSLLIAKTDFVPGSTFLTTFAVSWSWKVYNNVTKQEWIHQAILATDHKQTFVILNYCSGQWDDIPAGKTLIISGSSPVINYRDVPTRKGPYVFGVGERIRCSPDADYYCLTGAPHNFSLEEVTSTTAEFTFYESLAEFTLGEYMPHAIDYTVTCTDSEGGATFVVNTHVTSEKKNVTIENMLPYRHYQCKLSKYIHKFNTTQEYDSVISFKTLEDVPSKAPDNITIATVTSSTVTFKWQPLARNEANGNVQYFVNISSVSSNIFLSSVETNKTIVTITGLFKNTLHIATVTAFTTKGWGPPSDVVSFTTLIKDVVVDLPTSASIPSVTNVGTDSSFSDDIRPSPSLPGATNLATPTLKSPNPISSQVKPSLTKVSSDGTRAESKNLQTSSHDPNSVSAQTLSQSHSSNRHSGDMTASVGIDVPTNVAVSGVSTGDVAAIMLGVLYTVTILGVIASVPILWLYCRIRKQKKIMERASFNTSEKTPVDTNFRFESNC